MFKNRRRKVAALERVILRHQGAIGNIERDDAVSEEFKTKALKIMEEDIEALIQAYIAYEQEPIITAIAVICASISFLLAFVF